MPEERSNEMRKISKASHVEPDIFIEVIFITWWTFHGHGLFQVIVEVFVRIEFRTIGGKEDQLNAVLSGGQPLLDDPAVMDPQVIDDKDDLSFCGFDQLPQELDEEVSIEGLSQGHPLHFTPLVNGTDKGAVEALGWLAHDGRLSLGRVAATVVTFRLDGRFIAPPDLRFLGFGLHLRPVVNPNSCSRLAKTATFGGIFGLLGASVEFRIPLVSKYC